jgi:hypothetical protein
MWVERVRQECIVADDRYIFELPHVRPGISRLKVSEYVTSSVV